MRAMILAAGRGERMGDLTANMPKALLKVAGRYLIEYSLEALKKIGVSEIVINVCYHGEKIKEALGAGERYGVQITYSEEITALETGGGILKALPLLGDKPFIVLSCDVLTDYPLEKLPKDPEGLAHLVLVENPFFHPKGDFSLVSDKIHFPLERTYTFSNVGIYRKELFENCTLQHFPLANLMHKAILTQQLTGEIYQGFWHNLGTPSQLETLNAISPFPL